MLKDSVYRAERVACTCINGKIVFAALQRQYRNDDGYGYTWRDAYPLAISEDGTQVHYPEGTPLRLPPVKSVECETTYEATVKEQIDG